MKCGNFTVGFRVPEKNDIFTVEHKGACGYMLMLFTMVHKGSCD